MSKLAQVLLGLRERAQGAPGEWQRHELPNGLRLAWRVKHRDGHRQEFLVLQREGAMPSLLEQKTVIEHGLAGLAPRSRTIHPERGIVMLVVVPHYCAGCGKDLEVEAKMRIRENCLMCPEPGERRCHNCGVAVSANKGTDLYRCGKCRTKLDGR